MSFIINILSTPAILVGLISLFGLILQKKPVEDVVKGTVKELAEKKAKLGTSCMKDFNFHTAHLKYTVSQALILNLGEKGEEAVKLALADYVDTFGQEYLDVLNGLYPVE